MNKTPQLRADYLTEEVVLVSAARALRPAFYRPGDVAEDTKNCPFCPNNEHLTPGVVYRSACGQVRVVPNLYPAVSADAPAFGFHEVVIDTPQHNKTLLTFSENEYITLFTALYERSAYYKQNSLIKYIQIFKNDGRKAGASIPHSHWQIMALDFIPPYPALIMRNEQNYAKKTDRCFLCDLRRYEGLLDVYENDEFFSYAPFASPYSYMQNIVPKRHIADFTDFNSGMFAALGDIICKTLNALERIRPGIAVNICFFPSYKEGHFFLQIIPRIGTQAGLELGAGVYIASVFPEDARVRLKAEIAKLT